MRKSPLLWLIFTITTFFVTSCETYNSTGSVGMPQGTPVQNKNGFVTSPYSPYAGYIDVRGYPAGTIVNCPYSGKPFQVPENHYGHYVPTQESSGYVSSPNPSIQSSTSTMDGINAEMERIRAMRDPDERINANLNFYRVIMGSIDQTIENNPKVFGGISAEEFTREALYEKARERGLPPSEARIEAEKQARNMERYMQQ